MKARVVAAILGLLLFAMPSVSNAAYSITINTPAANTQFSSGADFVAGGTSSWSPFGGDQPPAAVQIQTFDLDGTSVVQSRLAGTFTPAGGVGDWSGDAKAPVGSPSEHIDSFNLRIDLFTSSSSSICNTSRQLKVKGPQGS